MSFKPYTPSRGLSVKTLHEGECSIAKSGVFACHKDDLAKVRVDDKVVIMTDAATSRIALRAPIKDEMDVVAMKVGGSPKGTTRRITAMPGVLKSMGLDPEQIVGRYPLEYSDQNGLLILNLTEAAKKQKARKK